MTDTPYGSPAWVRRHDALTAIAAERDRQDSLYPADAPGGPNSLLDTAPHTLPRLIASLGATAKACNDRGESNLLSVLMEEVGEVAEAFIEGDHTRLQPELVQVGGVSVKWLEILALAPEEAADPEPARCMAQIAPDAGGDPSAPFHPARYCWLEQGHTGPHVTTEGVEVW